MASFGLGQPQHAATSVSNMPNADMDSSTPWMAASEGNLSLLQTSVSALNLQVTCSDENGYTLLHAASAYAQIPVLEWLLSQGVDVNAVDNDGDSVLHHTEDAMTARILIEQGHANPLLRNAEGKTALEVKQDELQDLVNDGDDDSEDASKLRELIAYLSDISMNH